MSVTVPSVGVPESPAPEIVPDVWSCDSPGKAKDIFNASEAVHVTGAGYAPGETYDLYVVEDTDWRNGMNIPDRVVGTATTIPTDESGNISTTKVWEAALPGKYDIVIDVNGNRKYDEGIDALDDRDIEATAGFFVMPELPTGPITTVTETVKETVTVTTTVTAPAETVTETTTRTAPAETVTQTATQIMTTTKTESLAAMDMTSVAGAGIAALIIGVIVGWLVGKK